MSRFLAADYKGLVPYTPGEQPKDRKYVKLNTNESPFPPSPRVKEALSEERIDGLNLYSDPTLAELTGAIGRAFGVEKDMVFCGNGSDDVLAFAIMGFCGRGGELAAPDISYSFYPVFADLFGVKLQSIPLKDDFTVDPADYYRLGKTIVIANPNAPTGLWLTPAQVEGILAANPDDLVIIDEAYADFAPESCVPLVKKYSNLLVTGTFSKSRSLAGLRVGYGIAHPDVIADLNRLRCSFNPYNINALSIAAASAAIADAPYYDACIKEVVRQRETAKERLSAMGFTVLDSQANFVFARHKRANAEALYRGLREKGVLVRYFAAPRIDGFLRITVGSAEQMEALYTAMGELL